MTDNRLDRTAMYKSLVSGQPLTLRNARLATVGKSDLIQGNYFRGSVDLAHFNNPGDREAVEAINNHYWDCMEQEVFGRTYDICKCMNYIARPLPDEPDADNPSCCGIAGHIALNKEDEGFLHIVVFHVWPQWHGRGVGRKLLDKSIEVAKSLNLPTIKLGTTNDNLPALYFYQRAGFVIDEVITGDVLKSQGFTAPGFAGIHVRDEIRMRLDLDGE